MASASDHIALANRNQEALTHLLVEHKRFSEWITSIAFYKALHVIDAMLDEDDSPMPHDHRRRAEILKSDPRFDNVYKHYHALWNASCIARYMSDLKHVEFRTFADYLPPDDVPSQMVRHRLHQVEESALKFMPKSGKVLIRAVGKHPAAQTAAPAKSSG